jgi:hypothetical protein
MADQQNRGGKKVGQGRDRPSDQHQGVETGRRDEEAREGVYQRPADGQPGGPKHGPKSGRSDSDSGRP